MIGTDVDLSGKVNAKEGAVGEFKISSSLTAESGNDEMLLSSSLIRFTNQYVSTFMAPILSRLLQAGLLYLQ